MYVDRDCCNQDGDSATGRTFAGCPDLFVRLDIWHFIRRFSSACTTDCHPLYSVFLSKLSTCIFEWDKDNLALLNDAKRAEMHQEHRYDVSEEDVIRALSSKELAKHCRRKTRGVAATTRLIDSLIEVLDSEQGSYTMGVPLFNHKRMESTWIAQRNHVGCIQDVEGYQLY